MKSMGRKYNLRKKLDVESSTVNSVVGEDKISSLPEGVLANILSRLQLEEAVQTCVLSKSWMNKWTCISIVTICDRFPFPKKNNFLNFVEGVLNKISCIKHFTLLCFHKQDQSQVKKLISATLKCDALESLCVASSETNTFFSLSFFCSNSLIKLELKGCTFIVSAKFCFNHLRSLILLGVEFQNQQVSSSSALLFNMPMLEDLKLDHCSFLNAKSLQIHAPLLSRFEMIQCKYDCQINGRNKQCAIEITCGCSNLNFTYSGALKEKFTFSNPSAISSANLQIIIKLNCASQHFLLELGSRVFILLEKLSASLTMLELSEDVIMALSHWQPPYPLPMFDKLKNVEVPLLWFVNHYLHTSGVHFPGVDLLKNARVLETLTISSGAFRLTRKCDKCKGTANNSENYMGTRSIPSMPSNFLTRLKSVKFEIFHGWDEETQLVKFLVLFAPVLEELKIVCEGQAVANKLENQFLSFRTASARLTAHLSVLA